MSKIIVMHDTAAGPDGTWQAGQKYQVGTHISKERAEAFVAGRHAAYVSAEPPNAAQAEIETAEAAGAPENAAERMDKPRKKSDK